MAPNPLRFGQSLWISLLENYYDRFWADDFDATFAGTDIGQEPTGEQSRYVTLRFNFAMVNDKLGRQLNGNFDLLRDVIGEEQVDSDVITRHDAATGVSRRPPRTRSRCASCG